MSSFDLCWVSSPYMSVFFFCADGNLPHFAFNIGGVVRSVAWCPVPISEGSADQYAAFSPYYSTYQVPQALMSQTGPSLIQIWGFGPLHNQRCVCYYFNFATMTLDCELFCAYYNNATIFPTLASSISIINWKLIYEPVLFAVFIKLYLRLLYISYVTVENLIWSLALYTMLGMCMHWNGVHLGAGTILVLWNPVKSDGIIALVSLQLHVLMVVCWYIVYLILLKLLKVNHHLTHYPKVLLLIYKRNFSQILCDYIQFVYIFTTFPSFDQNLLLILRPLSVSNAYKYKLMFAQNILF